MNIKSIFGAACAAIAIAVATPAAAHGPGETVTLHFEHVIPASRWSSWLSTMRQGELRPRTCMRSRLSSSPTSCRGQSSRRLMTSPSGSTSPAAAICSPVTSQAERDACELKARILHAPIPQTEAHGSRDRAHRRIPPLRAPERDCTECRALCLSKSRPPFAGPDRHAGPVGIQLRKIKDQRSRASPGAGSERPDLGQEVVTSNTRPGKCPRSWGPGTTG
jgi:hypothetical protein